jgi:hypothetical protein
MLPNAALNAICYSIALIVRLVRLKQSPVLESFHRLTLIFVVVPFCRSCFHVLMNKLFKSGKRSNVGKMWEIINHN